MIVCTSPYLRTSGFCKAIANDLFAALDSKGVRHQELSNTRDLWCRDYMPVSLFDDGYYATYQYRPDYLWDKKWNRKYITEQSAATHNLDIQTPSDMSIIFDGGNYVRCAHQARRSLILRDLGVLSPQRPWHNAIKMPQT